MRSEPPQEISEATPVSEELPGEETEEAPTVIAVEEKKEVSQKEEDVPEEEKAATQEVETEEIVETKDEEAGDMGKDIATGDNEKDEETGKKEKDEESIKQPEPEDTEKYFSQEDDFDEFESAHGKLDTTEGEDKDEVTPRINIVKAPEQPPDLKASLANDGDVNIFLPSWKVPPAKESVDGQNTGDDTTSSLPRSDDDSKIVQASDSHNASFSVEDDENKLD